MRNLWLALFFLPALTFANDGASSGPAGGLSLRKEDKVAIKKELLTIKLHKVTVEYEFENLSGGDVKTFVQFPLPAISIADTEGKQDTGVAKSFEIWVDGKKKSYKTETRILSTKKDSQDYKSELTKLKIPLDLSEKVYEKVRLLTEAQKKKLADLGLLSKDFSPAWFVQRIFYWEQVFPAGRLLKVKHTYKPHTGSTVGGSSVIGDACVDDATKKGLANLGKKNGRDYYSAYWVDYILTTAKTWSGPIQDFTLIIEKESDVPADRFIVSTCFPGVKKVSDRRFEFNLKNFTPDKELSVYFFE